MVMAGEPGDGDSPARMQSAVRELEEVPVFGDNPGALRMHVFAPSRRAEHAPAVLVLHGCKQDAAGYDAGSGWSRLAEAHGFCLIYPEQQRGNNENGCFSWFSPSQTRRGSGEVESMREMVVCATRHLSLDPAAIFVTGLSAGGAMTAALLATYPELFAGGAIIAGLPFGVASSESEALQAMFVGVARDARHWGDLVRGASAYEGERPPVSIWYGTDDKVVKPINAGELVKQWTNVHGLAADPPMEEEVGPAQRRTWSDAAGRPRVRSYRLPGLGHGAPVEAEGRALPFFIPADLSSTRQIARDFGLLDRRGA
jgi:poly(hydroxyalkanoate) depolymerase family esterase